MKNNDGHLIIGASTVNSDLLYKVGVSVPDPIIYFKISDKEGVVVKRLEYERFKKSIKDNIPVFLPQDIVENSCAVPDEVKVLEEIIKKYKVQSFEVQKKFPIYYADLLRKLGVELKIAKGDFFPERKIKTKSEIDKIREAVRTAEKCMSRTETVLREAKVDNDNYLVWNDKVLTSEALHAEICFEAINNNSTAVNTIAASGVDSSQPHNIGSGPIKAGTPIVVDIFPRMNKTGYWGDMTRTFVKGKAPDKIKKAYETVLKAKEKAKEKIRNGVKASEIHKLAVDILDKQGFTTGTKDGVFYGFFHSLGHGLGLDIHENPIVSTKTDAILKTGNVITVEPGVYYREWGGIRLEDVIIVKDNGIECLTEYNEILELG